MIESRNFVPDYYAQSRDYQVFLKIVDIVINSAKADIDYFTSLISPELCKARMLPLLANYVGYNYDFEEKVKTNRAIIKNWPTLKHHRGSLIGISMAVALAFNQLDDLEEDEKFQLFNIDFDTVKDKHGRITRKIKVYVYFPAYLSKLYDLIEAVRPAGTVVEITPAASISSSETIVLTDEFRLLGYDYCTGKLLRIGNIPIYIENSWEIIKDGIPTNEYLVDGKFYDSSHTSLQMYIDDHQRIINDDGSYTGQVIIAPNIYKERTNTVISTGSWVIDKLDISSYESLIISQVKGTKIDTIKVPILSRKQLQTPAPKVDDIIRDNVISGTGESGAIITISSENKNNITTVVSENNTWEVKLPDDYIQREVFVTQQSDGSIISNQVTLHPTQQAENSYISNVSDLSVNTTTYKDSVQLNGAGSPGYAIKIYGVDKNGSCTLIVDTVHELTPTGRSFNLNHAARVLNTCYQIRKGGTPTNYFISADYWKIMDANKYCQFILKDYNLNGKLVKKVFNESGTIKYNWHIDMETGFFTPDNDGNTLDPRKQFVPWDENCYISKKRYIMNVAANNIMYVTEYFVNKYEDIEDNSGNIILSKKDRYKVSDSTSIGFSQVHDALEGSTLDKTWIYARDYSYHTDHDYFNANGQVDYNDYNSNLDYVDSRIKITLADLSIDQVVREYDSTTNIGILTEATATTVESNSATIPIDKLVPEITTNTPNIYLNIEARPGDDILSIFSELRFTFSGENAGIQSVFMDWKLKDGAELYYNVYELPDRIVFPHKGTIKPKTLTFTNTPIRITPKVYDGTTKPAYNWEILNNSNIE